MKYQSTPAFDREFGKLPPEHRRLFLTIVHEHFLPAIGAGSFTGNPPWPKRLRIHQIEGTSSVYSITWSFASPDGRATFSLERNDTGEAVLLWRRIGTHAIYDRP